MLGSLLRSLSEGSFLLLGSRQAPLSSPFLLCGCHHPTRPTLKRLTHWWSCQRLSPHNLGWSQSIQEIAELALGPVPGGGEDEPGEEGRGSHEGIWLVGCSGSALRHWALSSVPQFPLYIGWVYYFGEHCSALHIKENTLILLENRD